MKVAVIGSGGREHAICYKLKKSKKLSELYCIPGNAGTAKICENIDIDINNFKKIYEFIKKKLIDLIVVGPEEPLVNGIVDYFENKKIKIFGPSKLASRLEGSKAFLKKFCHDFAIPSAKYFEIENIKEAEKVLNKFDMPVVVKSDGLAAGKGVTICKTKSDALNDIQEILNGKFKSSRKVVIEEFLEGEEASFFIITDGLNYLPIGTAQDHKRIGEGDTGLNTGGMGAYSPSFLINDMIENKILKNIIEPTLRGLKKIGSPYKGILYAGLMIKDGDPKLIEYNIRFGDPECQVLMIRLKNDLLDLILNCVDNRLNDNKIIWSDQPAITIVAASKGYPENYEKYKQIKNLDQLKESDDEIMFHSGTILKDKNIFSYGGRVLSSTARADNLSLAQKKALNMLDNIEWENKYYRRDIGWRAIS